MGNEEVVFDGKKFISSRRASKISGYNLDYIGQLSRAGKLESRMVGRNRFVSEESLLSKTGKEVKEKDIKVENKPKDQVYQVPVLVGNKKTLPAERQTIFKATPIEGPLYKAVPPKKYRLKFSKVGKVLVTAMAIVLIGFFTLHPLDRKNAQLKATVEESRQNEIGILGRLDSQLFYYLDMGDEAVIKSFSYTRNKIISWLGQARSFASRYSGWKKETKVVVEQKTTPLATTTVALGERENISEDYIRRAVRQVMLQERDVFAPGEPQGGIVTVPSTGSTQENEALKEKIKSAFSDNIDIVFDESKTAGVIRPIFRDQSELAESYLFVLVPTKQ